MMSRPQYTVARVEKINTDDADSISYTPAGEIACPLFLNCPHCDATVLRLSGWNHSPELLLTKVKADADACLAGLCKAAHCQRKVTLHIRDIEEDARLEDWERAQIVYTLRHCIREFSSRPTIERLWERAQRIAAIERSRRTFGTNTKSLDKWVGEFLVDTYIGGCYRLDSYEDLSVGWQDFCRHPQSTSGARVPRPEDLERIEFGRWYEFLRQAEEELRSQGALD